MKKFQFKKGLVFLLFGKAILLHLCFFIPVKAQELSDSVVKENAVQEPSDSVVKANAVPEPSDSVVKESAVQEPSDSAVKDNATPELSDNKELDFSLLLSEEESSKSEDSHLSETQTNQNLKAFWKTAFDMKSFFDKSTTNTVLSTEIYGRLHWQLLENLSVHTQALVIGRNGFTQSIYDRSDRAKGLYLLEGFFQWDPFPDISMQFGNIQQTFLSAPLLITDKTFPSLIGKFLVPSAYRNLSFVFQAAIPDNALEFVRRETQIVRGFPLFLTSSIFFDSENFFLGTDISDKFTLFYYYNLSSAVADKSRIYGNTVQRTGSDSHFMYPYLGMNNSFQLRKSLFVDWIIEFGGEYIYNFLSPNTFNEGMRLYSVLYHNYKNLMELKMTGEIFANQSDSSVAYYNSETYGHNDRKGVVAEVQSHLYSSHLTFGASFVYSQPINDPDKSPIGNAFSFSLFLMTNYIAI